MKWQGQQRRFIQLPPMLLTAFMLVMLFQLMSQHNHRILEQNSFQQLSQPGPVEIYQLLSFGSERLSSYLMLLRLQLHDNQKGVHISYGRLNFNRLHDWLMTLNRLNLESDYPAFLAARVYSSVNDSGKIQLMIDAIEQMFKHRPERHWRRMTEATLLAKHQLRDLPQALLLAQQVADLPETVKLPFWARDMQLVLLDELGQKESAQLLISSLLQSGEITDNDEKRFLQQRLLKIQQELSVSERKFEK